MRLVGDDPGASCSFCCFPKTFFIKLSRIKLRQKGMAASLMLLLRQGARQKGLCCSHHILSIFKSTFLHFKASLSILITRIAAKILPLPREGLLLARDTGCTSIQCLRSKNNNLKPTIGVCVSFEKLTLMFNCACASGLLSSTCGMEAERLEFLRWTPLHTCMLDIRCTCQIKLYGSYLLAWLRASSRAASDNCCCQWQHCSHALWCA